MSHDPTTLFLHVGDAFATIFRHAPGFAAARTDGSWFASAGEASAIFSWLGLADASPANVATLRDIVGRLRGRRLEGLTCYPAADETALSQVFADLGLDVPEDVPLMVLAAADLPPLPEMDVAVERVGSPERLAAAMLIPAAAFDMPVEQTIRAFDAVLLEDPAIGVYTAGRNGAVVGALVLSRSADTVSIDIMAVDPAAQRRGIGRALMLGAMHAEAAAGATGFHLLSSTEGKRLYDQLGFTTLLETHVRFIPVAIIPADQVVT